MKKSIRLLSLINLIISGFALTLFLISILFQRTLAVRLFGIRLSEVLAYLPVVPLGAGFYISGIICISALHYFLVVHSKRGIWLEILLAACTTVVIPLMNTLLSYVQQTFVSATRGSAAVAAYSIAGTVTSIPVSIMQFSAAFLMLICGMGIVIKRLNKQNLVIE